MFITSDEALRKLVRATIEVLILQKVIKYIGWKQKSKISLKLHPFWEIQDELHINYVLI